jgi:hypothetical protein
VARLRLYWPGRLNAVERHLEENPNERRPDGDGCVLVFTHVFDDRALGAHHTAGWVVYLNRLDSHFAGNFLSEQDAHEDPRAARALRRELPAGA